MDTFAKLRFFSERMSQLLVRHPETVDIAQLVLDHISAINNNRRFKVAITGTMKQCKSTLICALVGRSLPTVGVNETTATLNYFNYGENLNRLIVDWKDNSGRDTEYTLDFLNQIQGQQGRALAAQINSVSLFSDAEFLKNVQLIDTPGQMGTHIEALDVEADALIRVLGSVATGRDQKGLTEFSNKTNYFGAKSYNTIAVMQMWEEKWPTNAREKSLDPLALDPFKAAIKRAQIEHDILGDSVTGVVPVSGLLALASNLLSDTCLNKVLEVTRDDSISKNKLISLLDQGEEAFLNEDCDGWSLESRNAFNQELKRSLDFQRAASWPTFKMMIWAAYHYQPNNARELASKLYDMSNLGGLKELLDKRFFTRSRLIQTGSELNTTLSYCDKALQLLRNKRNHDEKIQANAISCLQALREMPTTDISRKVIQQYVEATQSLLENIDSWNWETCENVTELKIDIETNFRALEKETAALNLLEDMSSNDFFIEARRILGGNGIEIHERLGCFPNASIETLKATAWQLLSSWRSTRQYIKYDIKDAVLERLDMILDEIDK